MTPNVERLFDRTHPRVATLGRAGFGANLVIQVLFYRLSFLVRQTIWKERNQSWAQLQTSPVRNEPHWWKWAMCSCVSSFRSPEYSRVEERASGVTSKGIWRQGIALKHRNSLQKELMPRRQMPLLAYFRVPSTPTSRFFALPFGRSSSETWGICVSLLHCSYYYCYYCNYSHYEHYYQ